MPAKKTRAVKGAKGPQGFMGMPGGRKPGSKVEGSPRGPKGVAKGRRHMTTAELDEMLSNSDYRKR